MYLLLRKLYALKGGGQIPETIVDAYLVASATKFHEAVVIEKEMKVRTVHRPECPDLPAIPRNVGLQGFVLENSE